MNNFFIIFLGSPNLDFMLFMHVLCRILLAMIHFQQQRQIVDVAISGLQCLPTRKINW